MTGSVQHSRLGDYELLAKLGEGGMGAVYKARQVSLDRIVAIKVLPRRFAADKNYLERFLREARATARLNHANIVSGIDVNFSDGYYYFVMEYIEAVTLRAIIKEKNTLPEHEVLRIGAAMAGALDHAHKANIIHRDVKPENILIDSDGVPKLTDLGLSKVTETENQDGYLTQAGLVVGTAYYIAPEQASGDARIDGRADIYSLGCTLYHAATGRPPHDAPTPAVLMVKHISEKIPHPKSINPELTDTFCNVLARMLARKPGDRYGTAAQAAKDMEQILAGKEIDCDPPAPEAMNFLDGPKPSSPEIKSTIRNSVKKAEPANKRSLSNTAPARMSRSLAPRQRAQRSWTLFAIVATAASLMLAALLMNYGSATQPLAAVNSHPAEKSTAVAETTAKLLPNPEPKTPIAAPPSVLPEVKRPVDPTPRKAPPPLTLDYITEPKADLSAMRSLISDPSTDPTWRLRAPKWEYVDGTLKATGTDGNASLFKRRVAGQNFELLCSIESTGFFHLGWQWSSEPANFIQHENNGTMLISRFENSISTTLTSTPTSAVKGRHDYRIVVQGSRITLYIDGSLIASTNEGATIPSGKVRDMFFYGGANATTIYHKILYRELPPTNEK